MAKKRRKKNFTGIVMGRDCENFYCWWHARFFPADKLLVCRVRGCLWCYEAYAGDAARLKRADDRRKQHERRRVAGLVAAV